MTNTGSLFEHGAVPEEFGAETLNPREVSQEPSPQFWLVTRLKAEYLTTGALERDALVNVADELGLEIEEFFSEATTAEKVGCDFEGAKAELVGRKAIQLTYQAPGRVVPVEFAD